ncbi:MAG: N-acetylmuramoyl-L-alanine amidase [Bacteroidales bacterium]|nr:N-acetylmuramoyl-L-alanine amidase [Bacteroidales bacterium]
MRIKTVVIDPGHGGKDPGTVSKYGYEKDLVLDVALKVGEYIEKYIPGVKVVYTRSTDVFIELHKRAEIANKHNADIFISIHANGLDNPTPFGSETFVMGLDKTDKNFEVVKKENAVILQEDNYKEEYGNFDPQSPEAYIMFTLYQNQHLKQSIRLSQLIQDQFRDRVGRKDRGVKQAPFFVLWKNESPSILVEIGFISNPEEGQFLFSDTGKDYMASAIYRAFKTYKIELDGPLDSVNIELENKEIIKPETKKVEDEVVFKVQFLSSPKPIALKAKKFNGLENVEEYQENQIYKYVYGKETDIDKIKIIQQEVRKIYPDAFIVAFKNDKKITIGEALKEIKN